MHPYYQGQQNQLKREMNGFLKLIAAELEEASGRDYPNILEQVWTCYREEFLERFPYIGGNKSGGTHNLTAAYYFVAMGRVCCGTYGMTLEQWGQLTTVCYQRYFEQIPKPLRTLAGKLMKHPKLINRMLRIKDAKNAKNAAENPGSFITETQTPTETYAAVYYMKACPLAEFARKYGYMEYMPYICNLDYVMFAALNVPFYREKTCAAGDGYCDFKLKIGAPVNPAWPCHSLTPGDPLK